MANQNVAKLNFQESGTGAPLLLIHGFPFNSHMWDRQLSGLSADAWVIAPDLPGFGKTPLAGKTTTVEDYAAAIVALLDAQGIKKVDLGGLSMGGYTALTFVRLYPERLRSLLLFSTKAGGDTAEGKAGRDKAIADIMANGSSAFADGMHAKLLAPANYEAKPEIAAELKEIMASASPEAYASALSAMRDRPDSTDLLAKIELPTLVIHGAEDKVIPPSEAEATAAAIPYSELHLIAQAGHVPNMEQPEEFDRIVREFRGKLQA
jgi:3-oxoadipate enol-lactonase